MKHANNDISDEDAPARAKSRASYAQREPPRKSPASSSALPWDWFKRDEYKPKSRSAAAPTEQPRSAAQFDADSINNPKSERKREHSPMEDPVQQEEAWFVDEAAEQAAAEKRRRETDRAIAGLNKRWRRQHERSARKQAKMLLEDAPGALADERLLLNMAARDASLSGSLTQTQALLAARVDVSLEDPKRALMLARALKEVTACRNAATKRAEELVLAASTIRVQRRLANLQAGPRLRRVA